MTLLTDQATDTVALLQHISEQIEALNHRLDAIERSVSNPSKQWLNKHEAAHLLNIEESSLVIYRQIKEWGDGSFAWIEGIHYHQMPIAQRRGKGRTTASYEYNRVLLENWQINRLDWSTHQRAIDAWAKKRSH